MNQIMMVSLYIIGSIYLAYVLGLTMINLLRNFTAPTVSKFLVGVSLLPFVLGAYMLVITMIPFRLPNLIYVIIPYIVATIYLCIIKEKKYYLNKLREFLKESWYCQLYGDVTYVICGTIIINVILGSLITGISYILVGTIILCGGYFCYKRFQREGLLSDASNKMTICMEIVALLLSHQYLLDMNMPIKKICIYIFLLAILAVCKIKYIYRNARKGVEVSAITKQKVLFVSTQGWLTLNGCLVLKDAFTYQWVALFGGCLILVFMFFIIGVIRFDKIKSVKGFFLQYHEMLFWIICISCMAFLARIICVSGISVIIGSDAIQYTSEAYDYALTMKFGTMNDFHGNDEGTLLSNIHSPVWPAYIANALLYSSEIGYPFDYAARMAFALTFVYMLVAVYAFARVWGKGCVPICSCIAIFANRYFVSIITNNSRDGFRIVAILVFSVLLFTLPKKITWRECVLGGIVSALVMVGHPINAMSVISIVLAYTIWICITKNVAYIEILKYYCSCIIGALLGSYQIIWALLETGSPTGGLIDFYDVFAGTSYYDTYVKSFGGSLGEDISYIQRIGEILFRDYGVISIPALAISIFLFIKIVKNKDYKDKLFLLVLIQLVQFAFFTDVIGWSGTTYTEWCYRNYRYTIQLYIFWTVINMSAIKLLIDRLKNKEEAFARVNIGLASYFIIPCFVLFIYAFAYDVNLVEQKNYSEVNRIIDELGTDKLLVDNYNMNYYLYNRGVCIWTQPVDSLRRAMTVDEFYIEAKRMQLGAVLITDTYMDLYWKNTVLEEFIHSDYIEEISCLNEKSMYTIYTF